MIKTLIKKTKVSKLPLSCREKEKTILIATNWLEWNNINKLSFFFKSELLESLQERRQLQYSYIADQPTYPENRSCGQYRLTLPNSFYQIYQFVCAKTSTQMAWSYGTMLYDIYNSIVPQLHTMQFQCLNKPWQNKTITHKRTINSTFMHSTTNTIYILIKTWRYKNMFNNTTKYLSAKAYIEILTALLVYIHQYLFCS